MVVLSVVPSFVLSFLLVGHSVGCQSVGQLFHRSVVPLVVLLVGRSVGCSVGCSVGYSIGPFLVGHSVIQPFHWSVVPSVVLSIRRSFCQLVVPLVVPLVGQLFR